MRSLKVGFLSTFLSFTRKELKPQTVRWWHYSFRQSRNSILIQDQELRLIKCPAIIAQCHKQEHFISGFKIDIPKTERDLNNLTLRTFIHPEILEHWDVFHDILLVAEKENRIEWRKQENCLFM